MPVSTALLLAGALVTVAILFGIAMRMLDGRRRRGGDLRMRAEDLDVPHVPGVTLVQFSTQWCARCPHVRRLLSEISTHRRDVNFLEIDLTDRGDLAARYRVLQTPTTFLVDASGLVLSRWAGVPDRTAIDEGIASVLDHQTQEQ